MASTTRVPGVKRQDWKVYVQGHRKRAKLQEPQRARGKRGGLLKKKDMRARKGRENQGETEPNFNWGRNG